MNLCDEEHEDEASVAQERYRNLGRGEVDDDIVKLPPDVYRMRCVWPWGRWRPVSTLHPETRGEGRGGAVQESPMAAMAAKNDRTQYVRKRDPIVPGLSFSPSTRKFSEDRVWSLLVWCLRSSNKQKNHPLPREIFNVSGAARNPLRLHKQRFRSVCSRHPPTAGTSQIQNRSSFLSPRKASHSPRICAEVSPKTRSWFLTLPAPLHGRCLRLFSWPFFRT